MAKSNLKARLIIAGPGAGKTHNMVNHIIDCLPSLSPAKYMAVITYTNSATNNIKNRLSQKITPPDNLFIGTIHAFLNRFILIPYASLVLDQVGHEKLFIQCQTDDVFLSVKKTKNKEYTVQEAASVKSKIRESLNKRGYITYDQTVAIAKRCMDNLTVRRIVSNRLQYLFVDEFQDTDNAVYSIVEGIRKEKVTQIYCVGDPEQYINSFDSSLRNFANLPILKASISNAYAVEINNANHRSSEKIVKFLNNFNGRNYHSKFFGQETITEKTGTEVVFIEQYENVTNILPAFKTICDKSGIKNSERCIIAKKNDVIKKIKSALGQKFLTPTKNPNTSVLNMMKETFLSTLRLNQTEFCDKYQANVYTLRKLSLQILKEINRGNITDENSYAKYLMDVLKFEFKAGLPIKIENFRNVLGNQPSDEFMVVSNIHTIKGLESEAVLAIAKTEAELLLWFEQDMSIRDQQRGNEFTDYPRLGYVAFSRAQTTLCIACLEKISDATKTKIQSLKEPCIINANP